MRNRRHQDPRKLQEVYANTRQRQTLQANTRQRQALQYMRPELRNRRHQESSKRSVTQSCGIAVTQSWGIAVTQSCGIAVTRSCGIAVTQNTRQRQALQYMRPELRSMPMTTGPPWSFAGCGFALAADARDSRHACESSDSQELARLGRLPGWAASQSSCPCSCLPSRYVRFPLYGARPI